jgi:hypothetical protein
MKLTDEMIEQRRAGRIVREIAAEFKVGEGALRRAYKREGITPSVATPSAGLDLSTCRTRVDRPSPSEEVRKRIFNLPKGRGFAVERLVDDWGVSEDTICKHARRVNAIRYVEKAPGDWVKCLVHPDTAEELDKPKR